MKQNLPNQHLSCCESWKLLRKIKGAISRKVFMDCLGVGPTQENRYCQPPDRSDYRRSPVDRVRNLVLALVDCEGHELALSMVNFISEPLNCRLAPINAPVPDKKDMMDECVDDYCEKTKLDELIRAGESLEKVMQQAERCKQEIDETIVLYCELCKDYNKL